MVTTLTLQRASAGSGKTYTLTKTYIYIILSRKNDDGSRTIRSREEILRAIQSVLAITFTNKATDEMKNRIIEKLYGLTTDAPEEDIDYLHDLITDLNCSRKQIKELATFALSHILDDYGSFAVSTIDSFFQLILRTLAYEVDLNQTYQVELDNKAIVNMGIEEVLASVNKNNNETVDTKFWIERLMHTYFAKGESWNIFAKKTSRNGIYKKLKEEVENLDNENFKAIKTDLDNYYSTNPDFKSLINTLNEIYDSSRKRKRMELRAAAYELQELMLTQNIDDIKQGNKSAISAIKYAKGLKKEAPSPFDLDKTDNIKFKPDDKKLSQVEIDLLKSKTLSLYNILIELIDLEKKTETRTWDAYKITLPWLKLILDISATANKMLEGNNALRLSDTNILLQKVISDDDTPFIYERLGTKLRHFLIDEFQDTSKSQWNILNPLVNNSISGDDETGAISDSLIIGDAKQSIYRFRNADSSIITSVVPQQFPNHHRAGHRKSENTNHRSSRRIITFNNYFFAQLAKYLDSTLSLDGYFEGLYDNVVQYPKSKINEGFIKIYNYKSETADSESDNTGHLADIPLLIADMLNRGYEQSDIAILVRTNMQATNVIEAIVAYNESGTNPRTINFVSETSLLVKASPAVAIIDDTLRAIAALSIGSTVSNNDNQDNKQDRQVPYREYINWKTIATNFNFFAHSHPEKSRAQLIQEFLNEKESNDAVNILLSKLPTLALPVLIEGIIEAFVLPEDLRNSQSPYIAAFQDFVMDYCDNNPSDIASFLRYWDSRKAQLCITSPEETDAVQVTTIHKSKGLEFPCVILPYVSGSFSYNPKPNSSKLEWEWVKPQILPQAHPQLCFPPYIPLEVSNRLKGTPHEGLIDEFIRKVAQDNINLYYVGFTRAVNELYIFSESKSSNTNINSAITDILENTSQHINDLCDSPSTQEKHLNDEFDKDWLINPDDIHKETFYEENNPESIYTSIYTIGEPFTLKPVDEKKKKITPDAEPIKRMIDNYFVTTSATISNLRPASDDTATGLPFGKEQKLREGEDPIDNDFDPRALGTIFHSIMQDINSTEDIDRAFRRLRIKGIMSRDQQAETRAFIEKAIGQVSDLGWFDKGLRIINERDLLRHRNSYLRPDRIILHPDGSVSVIDYKFGTTHTETIRKSYLKQVNQYAYALRDAHLGTPVRAYIWYVRLGEIDNGVTLR